VAKAKATTIRAFVAKTPYTKSLAPYFLYGWQKPKPQPFVHSWLSQTRLSFLEPISPRKHTIRAFVAKNLDAKSSTPYIPFWVAKAKATTIRAFVAKNLDAKAYPPILFMGGKSQSHNHSCIRG